MLKIADKLTPEKVDAILVRLLPDEKSPRRRMNRLESFIFTRSQRGHDWLEDYLKFNHIPLSDLEFEEIDRQAVSKITASLIYEYEMALLEERYWHQKKRRISPETIEARIMENHPGRFMARFPQNRGNKRSRNVSGIIYDSIITDHRQKHHEINAKTLFAEIENIIAWHPELEDNDRVTECRWSDELQDWDLVVVKPDGQIIGKPTKTIENILMEGIIAKSRTVGVSGRKLDLADAFLGILK